MTLGVKYRTGNVIVLIGGMLSDDLLWTSLKRTQAALVRSFIVSISADSFDGMLSLAPAMIAPQGPGVGIVTDRSSFNRRRR